jgi:hypothetical protein
LCLTQNRIKQKAEVIEDYLYLVVMETIETNSDYLPQPSSDGFATSQAPQIFSPFNSPQPLHKAHAAKLHAAGDGSDRKRKRADHDHSISIDVNHHTGFNTLNSPVHSNPDLDTYIKSKRKPREKKACQVCRLVAKPIVISAANSYKT